jgi:hypothetical protein
VSPDEAHELALIEVSRWQREAWIRMYGLEQDDSVGNDRGGSVADHLDSGVVAREGDGNLPAERELCDVREDDPMTERNAPKVALVGVGFSGVSKALVAALRQAEERQMIEVLTTAMDPDEVNKHQELYMDESYLYGDPYDGSGLKVVLEPGKNRKQRRKEAALERRKWRVK